MGLFSTKNVSDLQAEAEGSQGLKRALTATNLASWASARSSAPASSCSPGRSRRLYAGPAIVLSFVLAGVGCLFAGLCYAEIASMVPIAGSAYTYGYATMGEFIAWIIGWDLILEYLFAASTVAVGWAGYFSAFMTELGIKLPPALMGAPLDVEGTHHLVRAQICVDPSTGGVATMRRPTRPSSRPTVSARAITSPPASSTFPRWCWC